MYYVEKFTFIYSFYPYLVIFRSILATTLFIPSKGFSCEGLVTPPSLAVSALPFFTRTPVKLEPKTFLPYFSGGKACCILPTMSASAYKMSSLVYLYQETFFRIYYTVNCATFKNVQYHPFRNNIPYSSHLVLDWKDTICIFC